MWSMGRGAGTMERVRRGLRAFTGRLRDVCDEGGLCSAFFGRGIGAQWREEWTDGVVIRWESCLGVQCQG